MPPALMASSCEAGPFLRSPLRQSWALSLEKRSSWEIRPFCDWWISPFFSVLSPLSSPTGWYSLLSPLGKLCLRHSVSILHVVKRKAAALGLGAPCWRREEWQTIKICDWRRTGERFHRLSQQGEPSPTKASESFRISQSSSTTAAVFPWSRQDNDRLHTKRLKIAKWLRAVLFFFSTFAQLLSTESFSEMATDILREEKSRQGLENQEGKAEMQENAQRKPQFSQMGYIIIYIIRSRIISLVSF